MKGWRRWRRWRQEEKNDRGEEVEEGEWYWSKMEKGGPNKGAWSQRGEIEFGKGKETGWRGERGGREERSERR